MVGNSKLEVQPQGPGGWFRRCVRATVFSCIVALALSCRAALQFDVFPGFDSVVPEANWFPVVCEINNDGPSFVGTIEVTAGNLNQGQTRRVTVELPTGTTKRLVIPVFSTSRGYSSWDVRLYDERGKVRGEQLNLRARKQLAADAVLIGALSRTPGGTPGLPPILAQQSDLQPGSARLLPAIFPDNPLVLEGMSVLYLNSEKISDLRSTQVAALMHWLNAGGHLIIGVEQAADINAAAWLKNAFPCDLTELQSLPRHPELQAWLKTPASQTNPLGSFAIATTRTAGNPSNPRSGSARRTPSAIWRTILTSKPPRCR